MSRRAAVAAGVVVLLAAVIPATGGTALTPRGNELAHTTGLRARDLPLSYRGGATVGRASVDTCRRRLFSRLARGPIGNARAVFTRAPSLGGGSFGTVATIFRDRAAATAYAALAGRAASIRCSAGLALGRSAVAATIAAKPWAVAAPLRGTKRLITLRTAKGRLMVADYLMVNGRIVVEFLSVQALGPKARNLEGRTLSLLETRLED